MKFLSLLLGLVIFVAVLYQSVFTPAVSTQPQRQKVPEVSAALQTLKQAQELKQKLNDQANKMNYDDQLRQR
ncbi:hypothetical protein MNBD_GAMMA23-1383 [hydrothermal vent metagenome]|uniref:Uncharacterized protein n=1 Tax=hydrothermal vent metagenome TaxID=652676 RepID=A0A3B1ASI9_9ZZZZ